MSARARKFSIEWAEGGLLFYNPGRGFRWEARDDTDRILGSGNARTEREARKALAAFRQGLVAASSEAAV